MPPQEHFWIAEGERVRKSTKPVVAQPGLPVHEHLACGRLERTDVCNLSVFDSQVGDDANFSRSVDTFFVDERNVLAGRGRRKKRVKRGNRLG